METQKMQLTNWRVAGYWSNTPLSFGPESLSNSIYHPNVGIDATVPGSVYADLERAGLIADPNFEMNSLSCEWVANRWWGYCSRFTLPKEYGDGHFRLICHGIDYKATVHFNHQKVGEHEGMFIPFEADVTELIKQDAENTVLIMLESTPDEMGQFGYTSRTKTQRSRFYYKWDFSTRLVGVGLYDTVELQYIPAARMTEKKITTTRHGDTWSLTAAVSAHCYEAAKISLRAHLYDGDTLLSKMDQPFEAKEGEQQLTATLSSLQPELWWPNGHGASKLYTLYLELWQGDQLLERCDHPVGFRTLSYVQAEGRDDDSLPYQPLINGKRIYLKGVNLVPMDLRQGLVDEARYTTFLTLCKNAGINIVRIWGGGVIERELFYRICDRLGILVWQEFIQSSSGLENTPSSDPAFLALLKKVATHAVKYIRNHASLAFFSGGNELFIIDDAGKWHPCGYDHPNIAMLKSVVDEHDGCTMMLPTSASGPNDVIYLDRPGLNHDVHGPWKFYGPQSHYDLYNGSDAILQSEFGCDGFSCYESLEKFLSPANLKVDTVNSNIVWRHHGEWWDSYDQRERPIFGDFDKDDLKTLIKCNQFMQAEGIRYALEANRRRAHKNVGSIVWQFNEPWPNVFCTCIVDYYATPKLAYYAVADAFAPRAVLLRYSNVLQNAGDMMKIGVTVANDLDACDFSLKLTCRDHTGTPFYDKEFCGQLSENAPADLGEIELSIPTNATAGFTIETTLTTDGASTHKIYTILTKAKDATLYARSPAIAHYDRTMAEHGR